VGKPAGRMDRTGSPVAGGLQGSPETMHLVAGEGWPRRLPKGLAPRA
jgi:hypothetical protein